MTGVQTCALPICLFLSFTLCSRLFAFDHTHAAWGKWLKQFANVNGPSTTVNYKAAKAEPNMLKPYLKTLEAVTKAEHDGFTDPQKMSFLINAYNAFTVSIVTDNYPIKSIKDLGGLFSSPWKKKFFTLFGEEQNLDNIEHDRLRKEWAEPRVHFALVCASKGCPALRGEAYVATKLEEQLEAAAKLFLNDTSRNRWDQAENKLYLSKVFDWYAGDFIKKSGSVQSFVTPRMATVPANAAKMAKAQIGYLDYDWTLNETPARSNAGK